MGYRRDYDKEPIVIENKLDDYTNLANIIIYSIIGMYLLFNIRDISFENFSHALVMVLVQMALGNKTYMPSEKDTKVYLTNSTIVKVQKNTILRQIYVSNIAKITKTIDGTEELDGRVSAKELRYIIFFMLFAGLFLLSFLLRAYPVVILFILCAIAVVVIVPRIYFLHKTKFIDPMYNVLVLEDKKGRCLSFAINSDEEYLELHKYFLNKAYKNINKSEKRISSFLYLVFRD